jgi:DNA-3-methyladenine glycosylase
VEKSESAIKVALPASFFDRDTVTVARELLGKVLVSSVGDLVCGGRIVETEAYLGTDDPGSHAATRGITERNSVMYGAPATAYVYFTYGCHHMLNIVTERSGVAGAVLIRALEPALGIDAMRARRGVDDIYRLCSGPGRLAQALGIDLGHNGKSLGGDVTVCDAPPAQEVVAASGRVGLSAGHDRLLRFYLKGNGYVSKGRTGPPRKRRASGE